MNTTNASKALALGENRTAIRSLGVTKTNRLVRAARHLDTLRDAFAEWEAGEIYVCKKTGDYRYRFGDRSKSITSWNAAARELFASPAEFAFAVAVFSPETPVEQPAAAPAPQTTAPRSTRVSVLQIANAA
ncbi:hypothetical protein [Prosthecobacter sp.]|uniref:hypothetical protein n=1 Tax=Prosthecobacter sp. TaxID=1965333 RepID=UPI0037837800